MTSPTSPIIIIGMHRSGTTLIANLLHRMGLHQGWLLQENTEPVFFVARNEALMHACGGRWDNPTAVRQLVDCRLMRERAVERLQRDIRSAAFLSFLGPRRLNCLGKPERIDFPWGWKDPRNSFTLPLWLDLFPDARVIHVYRHPMDVARSLYVRENRSIIRRAAILGGADPGPDPRRDVKDIRRETGLLWLQRRADAARYALAPLRQYAKLGVTSTATLEGGLRLWSAYVGESCRHLANLPNESLSIRYEDVLADPVPQIDAFRRFCGLPGDLDSVRRMCDGIRSDRRFAYRKDAKACEVFDTFRQDEWVRHLGYHVDEV